MYISNLEIPEDFQPTIIILPFYKVDIQQLPPLSHHVRQEACITSQICTGPPLAAGSCSHGHFLFPLLRYLPHLLWFCFHCIVWAHFTLGDCLTSCPFWSNLPSFLPPPPSQHHSPNKSINSSRLYTHWISTVNESACKSVLSNKRRDCF